MRVLLICACATLPSLSLAGGLPEDLLSVKGRLALVSSDRRAGVDWALVGDATARLRYAGFGAELGVYGRGDVLDTPHETYGALSYSFPSVTLSVGVPRPAYDGFAVSALEAPFPDLATDRTRQTRSAATHGAMILGWLPLGAAVTGSSGDLSFGASAHRADAAGATVIGAGLGWERGSLGLSAAMEAVNGDLSGKAKLSWSGAWGATSLGYFAPSGAGDLVELSATVTPWERLGVTAAMQVPVDGGAISGGVSARYGISDHVALSVGAGTDAGNGFVSGFLAYRF